MRGATPESFAHDPAGNLLGQGDQPAANLANVKGNRLLMQGDRHYDYDYDAFGNLSRERRGAGQKLVTEYQYDCQHRLIGVSLPSGSTATYKYDVFGSRIAKTVDGRTTEFLWQGEQLIAESAENRYRTYIYEPGTFRPLAMLDGEGPAQATPFYYQLDHLGTPQELTAYSGEIMWSAKYRAYGNLAALDVSEIDNPLRFQGQYFDTETGLHYNRHRYYNPSSGRFLTPDPIKLAGGLNNYQYVPNPTGWVDPLGLNCLGQGGGKSGGPENPAAKTAANEGAPKAPAPQMTAEQRRARIEELSEANAKRRVQEFETKYDMHTIGKHGPDIPDAVMKQRAIDGTDPITGRRGRRNSSSQFNSWKLQMHAINEATTRVKRGLPAHTGVDANDNPIVRIEQPGSGKGYKPNRRDEQNPIRVDPMNGAEIKFDPDDPSRPYTAFPTKER
ncbi:type IV secretion protein Rhs [Pseudomonas chlororaphis subsp. aurantiaca PB-St2]|nr:type IV secretion protein Rhs [Pseudomonas chlororaphis subsp. aurantiaca PB-St2]